MKLLSDIELGNNKLKNRMVMSAMTRSRANINGVVGEITVEYYRQRVSAGLIISEAINISEDALGSPFTPGLYTKEQIEAWKNVTKKVHDEGGIVFAQLWHTGRVGHSIDRKGKLPVAPSAIAIEGMQHFTSQGPKAYEIPRALTIDEIKQTIKDYKQAAINAIEAGFDGVELHAANGYLPNQFLAESSNQRTDDYGGSTENRSRFILDIIQELTDAVGGDRVGIKLSPLHPYAGIALNNPVETYKYLIKKLNNLDIAFIELMKRVSSFPLLSHYPKDDEIELFGKYSKKKLIANTSYNKESGENELNKGIACLISFGTLFVSNPDLPERFKLDSELTQPDRTTFFGGGEKGYIDYPFLRKI